MKLRHEYHKNGDTFKYKKDIFIYDSTLGWRSRNTVVYSYLIKDARKVLERGY
jgi:hypothetical protein